MIKLMANISSYRTISFDGRHNTKLINSIVLYKMLKNRAWHIYDETKSKSENKNVH